jgi:flagellar biosynthesis/type III secretory pathway protein FliH
LATEAHAEAQPNWRAGVALLATVTVLASAGGGTYAGWTLGKAAAPTQADAAAARADARRTAAALPDREAFEAGRQRGRAAGARVGRREARRLGRQRGSRKAREDFTASSVR